ncbi:MAG: cellulose biosynthesis cyclic di-GMP-binding regulatory protein BcsB [Deltaproteobacteria bacterium]
MNVKNLIQFFTIILLLYTASGAGAETVNIPLHKIAPVGITDLKCSEAEFNIKLPIPERWAVKSAVIDFGYVNSSALLAQNSRLILKLNSYPLAQIELNPLAPEGIARVQLPADLLDPGYNDLTFYVTQHYTLECEFPCAPELWTTLKLDEASIELTYDLKPVPLELSSISDFLFDPKTFPYGQVNIVSEYNSPESALLASTVASGIALRFDYRKVEFSTSNEITPGVDNVIIGRKEFVEGLVGKTNLNINGPYIRIMHNPAEKDNPVGPADEGEIPSDGNKSTDNNTRALIIVSGNTLEDIRLAVTAIAVLSFPFPATDKMEIKEILLPAVHPYSGKLMINPGSIYAFKTLGFPNHSFKGFSPQTKDLSFRLPTDLLIEENRYAEISLHLAYGAGMRSDSVLNILLNDEIVTAIHLDNPNGAVFSNYKISIPSYLFNRGDNIIRFEPVLTPSVTGQCELIQVDNLFLSIFDDSTFKFPSLSHWVELPRIELFFQDGFPFTRWPDGRETTLYITRPDYKTISSSLNLIGLMSQKIGYPLLNIDIGFEEPKDWNREIIVVGDIATVPENIRKEAPLKYGPMVTAPYPVINNLNLNESVSTWGKIKNYAAGTSELQSESVIETAYSEQTGGLGNDQGVIMEFESPYQPGRSVLLVTAASDNDLLALTSALLDSSVQGDSRGDLALVDFTPEGYKVWSLDVGRGYYTGKLSTANRVKSVINTSRWKFFALLAISLLILTASTFYVLRRIRSDRYED